MCGSRRILDTLGCHDARRAPGADRPCAERGKLRNRLSKQSPREGSASITARTAPGRLFMLTGTSELYLDSAAQSFAAAPNARPASGRSSSVSGFLRSHTTTRDRSARCPVCGSCFVRFRWPATNSVLGAPPDVGVVVREGAQPRVLELAGAHAAMNSAPRPGTTCSANASKRTARIGPPAWREWPATAAAQAGRWPARSWPPPERSAGRTSDG
jgi:hypothetical protein